MGVSKVGALKRSTEVVNYRSGGGNTDDFKSPGRTKYEAVTLERGLTHDPDFEEWAASVHPGMTGRRRPCGNTRRATLC